MSVPIDLDGTWTIGEQQNRNTFPLSTRLKFLFSYQDPACETVTKAYSAVAEVKSSIYPTLRL